MRPSVRIALLSSLVFAPAASLAKQPPDGDSREEVVLTFKGRVGGSDQIKITPTRATWRHSYWEMPPEPVTLNGVAWDLSKSLTLNNQGETRFLPRAVDFLSARLKKIDCRDTVALERNKDSVIVHIADTSFEEASTYEFQVVFRPATGRDNPAGEGKKSSRPVTKRAKLRIVAEIDGSDQLRIDNQGAHWTHGRWSWPNVVLLNQVEWDPEETPDLKNEGENQFLKGPVDFSTARMTKQSGRDLLVMDATEAGLVIDFADSPQSGATYELTITFGDR